MPMHSLEPFNSADATTLTASRDSRFSSVAPRAAAAFRKSNGNTLTSGSSAFEIPPVRKDFSQSSNDDSVTTNVAITVGGLVLIILPTVVVGDELLILVGVASAVGLWFLAHRHGTLRGMVEAGKRAGDDRLEKSETKGGA